MACVICLGDFVPAEATELSCGHAYHPDCIFDWVKTCKDTPTCPLCRTAVEECEEGEKALERCFLMGVMMNQIPLIKKAAALGSSRCAFALGDYYSIGHGVGQDHALAEKYFKQADNYSVACRRLAQYASERGDVVQAVFYLKKAIEISPTVGLNYMILANLVKDTEEVVDLYMTILALYVDDATVQERVYGLLGKYQFKYGNRAEAFLYFQKCLELNSGNIYANFMAALTCTDTAMSHRYVDTILAEKPNDVSAICMKGKIYLRENRLSEADSMYLRARQLGPDAVYTQELGAELSTFERRLRDMGPITRKRRCVRS
jgi:tetratricopeptide (TPR) repeat protein